jgi:hypothetical protein
VSSEALHTGLEWLYELANDNSTHWQPRARALLAKIARLEQERDAFRRNSVLNLGAMSRWRRQAEAAEAALAVAREREQCLREGLDAVLHQLNRLLPGFVTGEVARAKALARAALAGEPAAASEAISRPNEWTAHNIPEFRADVSPGSASAAADEPGETPA